jgi:hypothetical protein
MADKTFPQAFNENLRSMGLPVPSTIYGTIATTLGAVGALAGAIAKVGASATVAEVFLTVPVVAGSTVTAAAVTEIVAVCGAVAASFYVGACIGSVLVAAYETLDVLELAKVTAWLSDVAIQLGESVDKFLDMVVSSNGRASPIRSSIVLAQK